MTPDQYELVAKHVHDIRYAERGRAVGPRVTDEDREFAMAMCDDLNTAGVLADDEDHALCVTAEQYEAMCAIVRRCRSGWTPGKRMAVVIPGEPRPEPEPIWMSVHLHRDAEPMTDAERLALDHIDWGGQP